MPRQKNLIEWVVILAAAAFAIGCTGQQHLTPTHGRAYYAAMRAQTVNPDAGKKASDQTGLDSQEAAIVAESYLKSLVPEGGNTEVGKQQVLIVNPEESAPSK
ncbi:MAG: hypothetical protein A2289_16085 [Deltaproteobacteria bacterium RIFOXYA12_FULL_58_15]|nr:MAG: hypothetical protein A2289_16085 [Deltaproteobacteria bacterium RIFOXYA12_FULL_58_15]OGR13635.1 MAG: hypothetical protein A2341_22680 [Deltaproteobacteria bacterium RIFOXYB12_FULL_58_9]